MNAIVWSITQSFSCYERYSLNPDIWINWKRITHVSPIEGSSLEMRWRPLNHDIRMQGRKALLSVVAICWRRAARDLLARFTLATRTQMN